MKKIKTTLVMLGFLTLTTSCVSKKQIVYFQNDEINQELVNNKYKTVFKADDLLQINVSAPDLETTKPFNLAAVAYGNTTNNIVGQPQQQPYLIDNEGFIDFPVLGKLKLAGLSRSEAIELIKNKLEPDYIKNPTINIRISNFTITILGDVKQPGTYTIPNERITILEAIGLSGDLNITGIRNIQVIREENNHKKTYNIDLKSNNIFTSPVYYLQQNDVVYVKPNNASSQDAAFNRNAGLFVSIGSVIITLIAVLTR